MFCESAAMHNNMLHHFSNLTAQTNWWWETQNVSLVQKNSKFIMISMNLYDYETLCFLQLCMKFDCFAAEKSDFKQVSIQKSINSAAFSSVQQCLFCWHFYSFFKFESVFCSLNLMLAYCKFESVVLQLQLVLYLFVRFDN